MGTVVVKMVVGVITLAFAVLTAAAVLESGYWGIFTGQFGTWAGLQVLSDVVLACAVTMFWMWRDARKTGRNVWPYFALTLVAGSFGPLLYLLLGPTRQPLVAPSAA
ncbi:MAG TPA: DUF2834 domain-containing protein [Burkholderiaceae bacterium]|nr:DUF2834 domain-containing protein [Burkholderiaceae bacterium]